MSQIKMHLPKIQNYLQKNLIQLKSCYHYQSNLAENVKQKPMTKAASLTKLQDYLDQCDSKTPFFQKVIGIY